MSSDTIEKIRQLERQRLRSLVDADIPTMRRLHADDFQLINPVGQPLSKEDYIQAVQSKQSRYRAWGAGEISVRLYETAAALRYRDIRFDIDYGDTPVHRGPMYHTNLYELRDGNWQIVWSQASGAVTL